MSKSIRKQGMEMGSPPETWKKVVGVGVVCAVSLIIIVMADQNTGGSGDAPKHEQSALLLTGSRARTQKGYAGCRQVEDTYKFTALVAAGDTTAALAFVEQSACQLMPVGTQGLVDDQSVWHDAICLREVGQPFCLWIPRMIAKQVE